MARSQVENGAQVLDVNMDEGLLDSEKAMVAFLNLIDSKLGAVDEVNPDLLGSGGLRGSGSGRGRAWGGYGLGSVSGFGFRLLVNGFD